MSEVLDENDVLRELMEQAVRCEGSWLSAVASHLLQSPGKLLRPRLVLETARLCSGGKNVRQRALIAAASVELMHMASLMHDDVIDEAGTRRGIRSVNAVWGDVAGILGGDVLIAASLQLAGTVSSTCVGVLLNALRDLCEGEALEIEAVADPRRTLDQYLRTCALKSGALLGSACRLGGLASNASSAECDALFDFGRALGVAFQVWDDIQDFCSRPETLGKPTAADLERGLMTHPAILLAEDDDEFASALQYAFVADGRPYEVKTCVERVRGSGVLDKSLEYALGVIDDAQDKLAHSLGGIGGVDVSSVTDVVANGLRSALPQLAPNELTIGGH